MTFSWLTSDLMQTLAWVAVLGVGCWLTVKFLEES